MLLLRGGQSQSQRNGTDQHKWSSSSPLLLVVRGLQWRRHQTMSVAAVEILQSRPLLLAGVQPKGGHKYLQGDCGTLGLGMASLYEGSRLSCREDCVANGVMPEDAVAVPSTAHLVVSVRQMKPQGRGRDDLKPIPCMRQ